MRNRFPGKCDRCSKSVGAGYGVTFRVSGQYRVRCDPCQSSVSNEELEARANVRRNNENVVNEPVDPLYNPQRRLNFDREAE